jgi:hypothetical protein
VRRAMGATLATTGVIDERASPRENRRIPQHYNLPGPAPMLARLEPGGHGGFPFSERYDLPDDHRLPRDSPCPGCRSADKILSIKMRPMRLQLYHVRV